MTLRITIETQDGLIATAEISNIADVSMMDYEVTASTVRSLDGSHRDHHFEIGNGYERYHREQTVWKLVQIVAADIASRERGE